MHTSVFAISKLLVASDFDLRIKVRSIKALYTRSHFTRGSSSFSSFELHTTVEELINKSNKTKIMGIGPSADQITTWYDEYLLVTTTGPAVNTNTTMSCKIYKYKDVASLESNSSHF